MTTYQVEYPDLEASSAPEIASMASFFNRSAMALAQNEGWALFFDVKRYKTKDYPAGNFSNLAGWLIDQRRAENYHKFGEHFTTEYYITFVYQLSSDIDSKTTGFFFKNKKKNKKYKNKEVKGNNLPKMQKEAEDFLDNYLCDMDVQDSQPLKIGDYYAPVMGIMDFPNKTYPAIFDALNHTMTEFRWTTRFIPLSKEKSTKEAEKYQNRFYSARKSGMMLFTEMAMNVEIDKENKGALEMEAQASDIQGDIALGEYVLGYYTSNLMLWDKKLENAKLKARKLQQIVRSCGFSVKEETFNNTQAWLGMMPGNVYANIRRPLISTKNFSNIIPLNSAWQGLLHNDFTEETCGSSIPLCTCSTS